jgi:hypothetical protein
MASFRRPNRGRWLALMAIAAALLVTGERMAVAGSVGDRTAEMRRNGCCCPTLAEGGCCCEPAATPNSASDRDRPSLGAEALVRSRPRDDSCQCRASDPFIPASEPTPSGADGRGLRSLLPIALSLSAPEATPTAVARSSLPTVGPPHIPLFLRTSHLLI